MQVLNWQVLIFVSIFGSYLALSKLNKKISLKVSFVISVAWTFWTIKKIWGALFYWQIGVIWVSFSIAWYLHQKDKKIDKQEKLINELKDVIDNFSPDQQGLIQKSLRTDPTSTISNQEHLTFLHETLSSARDSIIILSGWITKHVVNEKFIELTREALRRGVSVYIGYGYNNFNNQPGVSPSTRIALDNLLNLEKWTKDKNGDLLVKQIMYEEKESHMKLILCDNKFTVLGSNNWLSNSKFNTLELSVKVESQELTLELEKTTMTRFDGVT